jgi:hypothetical protein
MLEDYKGALFTGKTQYRKVNLIHSELHDIYTIITSKLALSASDDKRIILGDRISTKTIGHYYYYYLFVIFMTALLTF